MHTTPIGHFQAFHWVAQYYKLHMLIIIFDPPIPRLKEPRIRKLVCCVLFQNDRRFKMALRCVMCIMLLETFEVGPKYTKTIKFFCFKNGPAKKQIQ